MQSLITQKKPSVILLQCRELPHLGMWLVIFVAETSHLPGIV